MKRQPLYEQLKAYLIHLIAENYKTSGYKLPSEHFLTSAYNVSRITAKRAIEDLVSEGLVYRRRGSGTYISPDVTAETIAKYRHEPPESNNTAQQRNKVMMVIVPDITSQYYIGILIGICNYAREHGWSVQIGNTNTKQSLENDYIKTSQATCNGIIICPSNYDIYNQQIVKLSLKNFPLVLIDNNLVGLNITCIRSDSFNATYAATQYFIDQGRRNIGYISFPEGNNVSLEERRRGYENALIDNKIMIRKELILNSVTHEDLVVEKLIRKFLNNNRDLNAIITSNCGIGIQTMKDIIYTNNKGLLNNVIIFDDEFRLLKDLLQFKVKYIKQDAEKIGYTAAEHLAMQYDDPKNTISQNITIPCSFYFD